MKKYSNGVIIVLFMLFVMTGSAQTITNYTTTDGLPDNFICGGVAIDGNNHVWVGTAAGLSEYDGNTWTNYTTTDGLIDNYILCIAADSLGYIWIGTNSGVSKYDGATWTNYTTSDGLVDNSIIYIYADATNRIWFATGVGISMLDGSLWTTYTTSDGLASDVITYITGDAAGNIWIGTQMGGYSKFNTGFTNYTTTVIDSLASDNVFALSVENSGTQWVGTWSGISKIDNSGGWMQNYRMADGLYNDFVRDLKNDNDGDLWVALFADYNGDGGISQFDGVIWTSYSIGEGLADKQVIRIAIDADDNVWVATGNGVSKLSQYSGISSNSIEIGISPNPASDFIQIETEEQCDAIKILNSQGQVIYETVPESATTNIETSSFSQGIYIVQVSSQLKVGCRKLVIR